MDRYDARILSLLQKDGRISWSQYYAEGRYWDSIVMGILRNEFDALHVAAEEAEVAGV